MSTKWTVKEVQELRQKNDEKQGSKSAKWTTQDVAQLRQEIYRTDYQNYLDAIGKVDKGWLSPVEMQGVIDTVDSFSKKYKVDSTDYDTLVASLKEAQSYYSKFKNQLEYDNTMAAAKYADMSWEELQAEKAKQGPQIRTPAEGLYLTNILSQYNSEEEYNADKMDSYWREKWAGSTAADIQDEIKWQTELAGGETDETKWLKNYGITVGYSDSQSYLDDISATGSKIEAIDTEYAPLKARLDAIVEGNDTVPEYIMDKNGNTVKNPLYAEVEDLQEKMIPLEKQREELVTKKSYLERKLKEIQAEEVYTEKHLPVLQAADFEEKSKTDSTVTDNLYRKINGLPLTVWGTVTASKNIGGTGDDMALADHMEPDEKSIYNYYFKEDPEKAEAYFDDLRPILNDRKNTKQVEDVRAFADFVDSIPQWWDLLPEDSSVRNTMEPLPDAADIITLGSQLIDGVVMAPVKFIGSLTGDYEDNWAAYDTLTTFTNTIRTDTAQDLNKAFGTEWAGFVYNTVMSIGDMAVSILASKGIGTLAGAGSAATGVEAIEKTTEVTKNITQIIMSSEAATQTMTSARERGLSGVQIAGLGLASACIEAITEKYSLEALFADPKNWVTHVLKNIGAEASEEAASNVLNLIADEVIAGNQSQIKQQIGDLMASGKSYEDAAQQVLLGKLEELGMDALGGALSGGIMGGGSVAINRLTTVHFSVPSKYKSDLASAQSWVLEKFQDLKNNITVKKLGTVSYDVATMTDAVGKTKNADQAVAFLAMTDVLHKKSSVVEIQEGGKLAAVGAVVSLNGNTHTLNVSAQKMNDGGYFVNGVILDGEVIYDASAYAQQALDSQATEAADSGGVAPKLVAGEGGQDTGFDYDSLNRITQTSGQRAPVSGAASTTQGDAVPMSSNVAAFEQQNSATTDGDADVLESRVGVPNQGIANQSEQTGTITVNMDENNRADILRDKQLDIVTYTDNSNNEIDFAQLETAIKSKAESVLLKKLKGLGFIRHYKTDAVDVEFDFTMGGLRKSLHSQMEYGGNYSDFAKVITNLQALIDSSVLIETHTDKGIGTDRENQRLKQVYVLLSGMQDGNNIIPVQFEIQEFMDNNNRLYLAVSLTKIETGVMGNTAPQNGTRTTLLPISKISIPELFSKINPRDKNFCKYIPDIFLNDAQRAAKQEALREENIKYGREPNDDSLNPDVLESRSYDYTESKENWKAENRNEGSTAEVESLDSIVADIEETFGVPINKGNIRQKKAAGIYKTKVQAIRTQLGNALPTICHELGHHLDRLHKLTQLGSIGEAVEVMQKTNPEFSKLYGENQQKGEAVAEFIREYLRDRTAAKQKYPKFFAEVVNALGEDLGKLNAISDKVNAYMYASMSEHIAANTTNRTNARRKKGGFAKRMKSTVDWVVKHMFEDVIAIRDVSEKAYKGVYDARKAATVVDNIINNGMTDVDGNYVEGFEGVSLKSILEPINNIQSKGRFKKLCESITGRHESSYDEFGTYLVLKRGLDLAGRGIPIFGNGDPSMRDPAKIQQEIDKMEAEYPEFKEVADQLYAWEKALGQTYYVNTGAMSQADFDAMWERDPHYVPFNRNVRQEIVKNKSSSRFGRDNSEIKRIKGGSEELFDPIENIVLRSALMVQNAKNGRIMQILALEVESGRIDSSIMEKISETKAGAINAALDQKADALKAEEQTDGSFDDVDLVEWTGQAAGENIVWATINGERVLYEVHDPELLQALLNSTPHQADILTQVIGKVNSAFKMATTGANLIWSVTSNSFRDFATGYYYGSEGNFFKYTRDYVMAARDVIRNKQSYSDAKAAGLGYTSRVASPKTLSRVMLKLGQNQEGRRALTNAFNSMIEGIQSISEVVEVTPRLAEYKRAIQQGKSKTDAVYAASEVTLNFDRKGDWSKAFDMVYPFFNVQMQGLYKQAQMIADPTTRTQFIRRKVVSSFVMAAFVIAANAVLGGKDEYEKLSDYTKNNYYCFYIGNGKFIKIPKARELDVLESALERMGEIICYGNDVSDSFNGFAEYIFQAYAPLGFPDITALFTENGMDKLPGFFKPTFSDLLVLGSFAEIAYNENYAGSPIVPTQYQDLHATEQYDNKTSGIAKLLGRITRTSPMQIDHLMVSNTGFIGKLLKAWTAEDVDWLGGYGNQFTADVAYSNDVTDQFYDGLDEAEIDAKTYPDNAEYQARYQQYSSVSSVVSYFYKQAKADPENAREYRMLAVAYAEEFLEGGDAQSEKLNALYEQTGEKSVYPYRSFESSYSQKQKDENGEYVRDEYDNTVSEEITLSPQEFLEYINTYNETIDVVYEEILSGITEPKLASKALSTAKEDINGYARSGILSDLMIAREAGISAADYYQITLGSSTNGASGVNQTEARAALDKTALTKKQRSVMWDLMFPKAKHNPYGKSYY